MAKGQTERTKKSKTSAQLAKKADNERRAAERLIQLQTQQKLVHEMRAAGMQGSDMSILAALAAKEKKAEKALLAEKKNIDDEIAKENHRVLTANQKQYVEDTLDGPLGAKLKEWLDGNPATIKSIENFLKING